MDLLIEDLLIEDDNQHDVHGLDCPIHGSKGFKYFSTLYFHVIFGAQ